MMKTVIKQWVKIGFFSVLLCALFSCSQKQKDKEAKADLTVKAKSDQNFAGVRFVIENGIVTLTGNCPSEKSKTSLVSTVENVYGVDNIIDNIIIAPVTIGTDLQLKLGIDSILGKYPGVQAVVTDSMVQLQGQAKKEDQQKLLSAIQTLQPKNVESQVLFK